MTTTKVVLLHSTYPVYRGARLRTACRSGLALAAVWLKPCIPESGTNRGCDVRSHVVSEYVEEVG